MLFHPVCEILKDAVVEFIADEQQTALSEVVAAFKARFSAQGGPTLNTLRTRWTPQEAAAALTEFAQILTALGPSLGTTEAANELLGIVAAANRPAIPDDFATLDEFLTAVLQKWPTVEWAYWRARRERWKAAADLKVSVATQGHLLNEIRLLYEHVRSICSNNDVLGAIIEEFVRAKIASLVFPLHVSNGSIHGLPNAEQLDGIIWERQRGLPAIEVGNTAIVAPHAVRAIVEVKASCDSELASFGQRIVSLIAQGSAMQDLLGTNTYPRAFGLIVWSDKPLAEVQAITRGAAVSLFHRDDQKKLQPNPDAMFRFDYFLTREVLYMPSPIAARA
ncbi:MAG: hypothetical protein U0270_11165 [Labilithrix sp.]